MSFNRQLEQLTVRDRDWLVAAPVIQQVLAGQVTRPLYLSFLTQAWHHVRHTVPLMMAVGARTAGRPHWLLDAVAEYIGEEIGHDEWILNDIERAGGDRGATLHSAPAPATDAMIGYAYDVVMRRNPLGFFGMVFVLEGTSVALALRAAERIQEALGLPAQAMTYLRSHGELDREHVHHLAGILDRLDSPDRADVVASARTFYWLYGNVFRSLDAAIEAPADLRRTA